MACVLVKQASRTAWPTHVELPATAVVWAATRERRRDAGRREIYILPDFIKPNNKYEFCICLSTSKHNNIKYQTKRLEFG
jgi:hypothetical protein